MEELKFEELELCPEILKAVKHMGFEEASPIQSKAIPVIMSGKDVIGQAQTGTGKTAAFGIKGCCFQYNMHGDCKTDSFSEKRHTACDRNTGTCDGSYAPQNYENGSCAYDRAG